MGISESGSVTTSDGCRLATRIDGREGAPWVVLSCSLGTNLAMWTPQLDALAATYRVLRYDSRGHGASDAPEGPYTIERLGQDVVEILDASGIERARFCGLSMGGMVGQWLGARAPDATSSTGVTGSRSPWPSSSTHA
jgi:3-oxoadipate enol-lactonase